MKPGEGAPTARSEGGLDRILLGAVLALVGIGLMTVFSATAIREKLTETQLLSYSAFKSQLIVAGVGFLAIVVLQLFPYQKLARLAWPGIIISFILLCLTWPLGTKVNGAHRWIDIAGQTFQPAEFAKLAFIIYLADSLARKQGKVVDPRIGIVPHFLVCAALATVLSLHPDNGSAAILAGLLLAMLFAAGTRLRDWALAASIGIAGVATAASMRGYVGKRVASFLDSDAAQGAREILDRGTRQVLEQTAYSKMAFGSGGITGRGLGSGIIKIKVLRQSSNDYIFAVVGEELGLIGALTVIVLFAVIFARGMRAALRARDAFGAYLAIGISLLFAAQACIHMAVVMDLMPAKGLTLPLVSAGGTSLVMMMIGAGLLLAIGRGRGGFFNRTPGAWR